MSLWKGLTAMQEMPGSSKKLTAKKSKFCPCCRRVVSIRTEFRHRLLQAPPRISASSPYQIRGLLKRSQKRTHPHTPAEMRGAEDTDLPDHYAYSEGNSDPVDDEQASNIVNVVMSNASENWTPPMRLNDSEESSGDDDSEDDVDVDEDDELSDESSEMDIFDGPGERYETELAAIGMLICLMVKSVLLIDALQPIT